MMTPAMGTKLFEPGFAEGQVFDRVGGKPITAHMFDGNYVVASTLKRPHVKQLNMLIAYLYFYNPVWPFVRLLNKTPVSERAAFHQLVGMAGRGHTHHPPHVRLGDAPDVRQDRMSFAAAFESHPNAQRLRHHGRPRRRQHSRTYCTSRPPGRAPLKQPIHSHGRSQKTRRLGTLKHVS